MEQKFDSNVLQLEKEIYNITDNINKLKNKSHLTMKNMMEKLKSFSNTNKEEKKKKSLIKTLSNRNISPHISTNKICHYEKNYNIKKTPMSLKENNLYNNDSNNNNKMLSSNLNANIKGIDKLQKEKPNVNKYENNDGRKICKSKMNKGLSYIINNLKNDDQDNNDIKRRINSFNPKFRMEKSINNDLPDNNSINNDFIHQVDITKNNKIEMIENSAKNSNNNKNEISKKLIKNIKSLIKDQKNKSKQINNIKREHCNINISEYYKNLNNSGNSSKKKNDKINIVTNNKKLKKYPSARNSSYKMNNISIKRNVDISNHSTRNSLANNKHSNTFNCKKIINNTNDYNICVCTTFNPDFQINNYNDNENYKDELFKEKNNAKIVNPLNDYNHLNKNMMMINNTKKNNVKDYQYDCNKNERNFNNNSFNHKNNISFNIDEDICINKKQLVTNNNYSKDFIDIITNRNSNNYYDSISIHNNNKINENKNYKNNKYININREKYVILLSRLKCRNLDEIINKIEILLNYEEFTNKIMCLYYKYNNYIRNKRNDLKDMYSWIKLNIENYRKNKDDLKKYQNFCGKLMDEFSIDGYDKFKNEIMKTVNETKKNNNFTYGMKKILYNSYLNNGSIIKNNFSNNNNNNDNSFNSQLYNSNDNMTFRTKTNNNFNKNFILANKSNKDIINLYKNYL
jgi:hypothetical protein